MITVVKRIHPMFKLQKGWNFWHKIKKTAPPPKLNNFWIFYRVFSIVFPCFFAFFPFFSPPHKTYLGFCSFSVLFLFSFLYLLLFPISVLFVFYCLLKTCVIECFLFYCFFCYCCFFFVFCFYVFLFVLMFSFFTCFSLL